MTQTLRKVEQEESIINAAVTVAVPILSKDHLERLILRSEGVIAESLTKMTALEPDLNQARQMYEELLKQYTEIELLKQEEEKVLDCLVRHRNGYRSKEEIRLIRTTSHTKKKAKVDEEGRKIRIPWSEYAREVLAEANRFMRAEDIFDTIVHRNETMKSWDPRTNNKYKWSFVHTIIKVPAERFKETGKGTFVEYKDLIGLPEWVDKHHRPKHTHLAQFMVAK